MEKRFYPHSIYNFLRIAESNMSRRRILDCGAGGKYPKIAIFQEYGYELYGIDTNADQLKYAREFASKNAINLNITEGDMREIPFENEFFGYVMSYLSMVHLIKTDIAIAINEIHRVLQKGGLCYINFLSKEDKGYDKKKDNFLGEIKSDEKGFQANHSYFEDGEPDKYFQEFEIIYSAKIYNFIGNYHDTRRTCILDYIAKKI
jgi:ubiquinone/menaquinone biosynthesis C-methylase UbiE